MEIKIAQSMPAAFPTIAIGSENLTGKAIGFVAVDSAFWEKHRRQAFVSAEFNPRGSKLHRKLSLSSEIFCSYNKFSAPVLESECCPAFDETLLLKKSEEIQPYLKGRCIFLVGMMGSGKTTVGKIVSKALGYSFQDSDKLIEQELNGTSISEIFKLYGEGFFRDKETEVLQKLSVMRRLVISTGGGAVTRPINWKYMQKGISVWLDVPLEALALRIAAVGTKSRPLLHNEPGDEHTRVFTGLSSLLEERNEAYALASARVSLDDIAAKISDRDVSRITPTSIAIEALVQIHNFVHQEGL